MPNLNNWFNSNRYGAPSAADRAVAAWRRIQDKPSVITRVGIVGTQTVRIEYDNASPREVVGDVARTNRRGLIIFGVRDHPNLAVADTVLESGDRIIFNDEEYEIEDVVLTIGEVQAKAYRDV